MPTDIFPSVPPFPLIFSLFSFTLFLLVYNVCLRITDAIYYLPLNNVGFFCTTAAWCVRLLPMLFVDEQKLPVNALIQRAV